MVHFTTLASLALSSLPVLATPINTADDATSLTIASALTTIEYTPELVAKQDFYKGEVTISNGGVANIFSGLDLAANAETQALRQYSSHKNLRIIYTVCEVAYRIVASKKAGITSLKDLKGKKIGSFSGTSAAYFTEKLLRTAGLEPKDYTIVSGNICNTAPCGAATLPGQLARGAIDAIGMWEPTVQLAADALPAGDAAFFTDKAVYREIYNLHSTAEKLKDPVARRNIVEFIRALNKAEVMFTTAPATVWPRVSAAVGVPVATLKEVWPVHNFSGPHGLPGDLLDVLVEEDQWLAKVDRRSAMSREVLSGLIDDSVYKEAMAAQEAPATPTAPATPA